jgi:hypothetical protein
MLATTPVRISVMRVLGAGRLQNDQQTALLPEEPGNWDTGFWNAPRTLFQED